MTGANDRVYLTTTIPYVNARPHVGLALEYVQADVLARHYRQAGQQVRFQTGTDDNSLKNVLAARAAGIPVARFVDASAQAFIDLAAPLSLSVDDVIRTSSDPRHAPGVRRLWQSCAQAGDLYRKHYEGLYCVGCEQFYVPAELTADGRCPDHGTPPEPICEWNWFFRLSRHEQRLHDTITSGQLRISPASRRNEVLAFIAGGLDDFSVSRSRDRAAGWGISVPGDPDQVVYVWFDALANYITALGYGAGASAAYQRWWAGADRRVHLLGKGVLRFHAVYWPAILLSAGLPLPTELRVHDYLTVAGARISKSAGNGVDPAQVVARVGPDALRWWLLREVPRVGDADFTIERVLARANDELANGFGNLVNRVVSLVHRYRSGRVPDLSQPPAGWQDLQAARDQAAGLISEALANSDFRAATAPIWALAQAANRLISSTRPWELARAAAADGGQAGRELDAVLATLVETSRELAWHLAPFLPDLAARIARQVGAPGGLLPPASPVFARLAVPLDSRA
jgi:methionyl-tRNA synthetase